MRFKAALQSLHAREHPPPPPLALGFSITIERVPFLMQGT